jgi:guanylate kinase
VTGTIFVVTAPSGTGKTTLLKALLAADPGVRFSVSYTTRLPRPGEVHGRDYFFVTRQEFDALRDRGALVEWVEQFGYAYGTSREWVHETLKAGQDLMFDLDSRGAKALKDDFPHGAFIFILPPSLAELKRRLEGRGDLEPAELARRFQQGRAELQEVHWYDYLVVNDDLARAQTQLRAIVQAARCRTAHLWPHLAHHFLAG